MKFIEIFKLVYGKREDVVRKDQPIKAVSLNDQFKEFLLKEYENIWGLIRTNYDIRDRWIKFYLGAIGLLLSFYAALIKFHPDKNYMFLSHILILILIFLVILGLSVLAYEIGLRSSRVEFYNSLNLIRRAFLHTFPAGDIYLSFPTTPTMKSFGKRDFVSTFSLLIFVSINFGFLIYFLSGGCLWWSIVAFVLMGLCLFVLISVVFRYLDREKEEEWKKRGLIEFTRP